MKTTLNLYHESCRERKLNFNFAQFIVLLIVCILLVGLIKGVLVNEAHEMAEKKTAADAKLLAKKHELSQLLVQLQANRVPEEKLRKKEHLSKQVADKQRLVTNLNQIDLGLVVSFSELMLGLSKADTEQISLSEFSIVNGKLNIKGQASYSDSVPRWLTRVQATTELHMVSFTTVDITQQKNIFLFELSNIGLNKKTKDRK
ncbi:hypothetical protein E2R68_01490 [Psychromonas sp. RZ22]|uniref:PilN domain-containing protein n=1 Tax=Psychromonas algarum TaxID=2555643 RepID=UPI00106782F3|nr:PilN domain-containing protein [Psychromonas sp. RZ22]TEW56742.1 hypothetical protein E2R68_01490 [Psychromonas sp. RZ22]